MEPNTGKKWEMPKNFPDGTPQLLCRRGGHENFPDGHENGENGFLLLLLLAGSAVFHRDGREVRATSPCFVCLGGRQAPPRTGGRPLRWHAAFFHPAVLDGRCSHARVHGKDREAPTLRRKMRLLRPFTDERRFVFPIYEKWVGAVEDLFIGLEEELSARLGKYWTNRSRAYLTELLLRLERLYTAALAGNRAAEPPADALLQKALAFLETHFAEAAVLDGLSASLALSPAALAALFKDALGVTPEESLRRYRVAVAKRRLAFTDMPLQAVALACGFRGAEEFARNFEAQIGVSPQAYRESEIVRRLAAFGG